MHGKFEACNEYRLKGDVQKQVCETDNVATRGQMSFDTRRVTVDSIAEQNIGL
jgi:hypothetical protein